MTLKQIEQRLCELEKRVDALSPVHPPGNRVEDWIAKAGTFRDDPVFEEIVKLGREYRKSLRPKPGPARAKSK